MPKAQVLFIHDEIVTITSETIAATYDWFAANSRLCASEAKAGKFFVNDLDKYVEECEAQALEYEACKEKETGRFSFAFMQRAYYIQTGESIPLLN